MKMSAIPVPSIPAWLAGEGAASFTRMPESLVSGQTEAGTAETGGWRGFGQ
jgi:hypothetical protein